MNILDLKNLNDGDRILALPIDVENNEDAVCVASKRLDGYRNLINAASDMKEELRVRTNCLIDGLKDVIVTMGTDFDKAAEKLKETLSTTGFNPKSFEDELKKGERFYRLRRGVHSDVMEMFHCPYNKTESERFSRPGTAVLYCGATLEGCVLEIEPSSQYTTVEIELEQPFKIFDLACVELNNIKYKKKDGQSDVDYEDALDELIFLWPILAMCYLVCKNDRDIPKEKTTYFFPQLLAEYIADNCTGIEAIRYYTVRKSDLNPVEKTFTDIAFFTHKNDYNEDGYDMKLYEKIGIQNITVHEKSNNEAK